jgi:hypothetical protein
LVTFVSMASARRRSMMTIDAVGRPVIRPSC